MKRLVASVLASLALAACSSGSSPSNSTPTPGIQGGSSGMQEAPKPTITDLGAGFIPVGVDDSGRVVGNVQDSPSHSKAATSDTSGKVTDLPGLNGSSDTNASFVSPTGIIAGNSGTHAVLWKNGQPVDLGGPSGAVATAANDQGDAVGYVDGGSCPPHATAVAWFGGKYTQLANAPNATAIGINNRRQVLLHLPGGPHCGFNGALALWDSGSVKDLSGTFPGGFYAALNDSGMVVGPGARALDLGGSTVSGSGTVVEIGRIADAQFGNIQISEAKAVNRYGEVVGILNDLGGNAGGFATDASRAYLWDGSAGVLDLTGFLNTANPNSKWVLQDAVGINNSPAEQITGTGKLNGQVHAFLLSLNRLVQTLFIGDSFMSGEGNPPFPGTDTPPDQCHRSTSSWPFLLAQKGSVPHPAASYACSGETAEQMGKTDKGFTYQSEPASVTRITGAEKLIVVMAGGDDIGFGTIGKGCVALAYPEAKPFAGNPADCGASWVDQEIGKLPGKLDKLYSEIASKKGTGTRVLVVGYPNLLPDTVTDQDKRKVDTCYRLDIHGKMGWLRGTESKLNSAISSTVAKPEYQKAHFEFVDMNSKANPAFKGMELCQTVSAVNDVVQASPPSTVGASGVFHPNLLGQLRIQEVMQDHLK